MPSETRPDQLFPMLVLSLVLHSAALTSIYVYAKYLSHEEVKVRPDAYVVHFIDPGEVPGEPGTGKSSIVETAPPQAPSVKKSVPIEKKIIPVTKEAAKEVRKTPVVKKVSETKKNEAKDSPPPTKMKSKAGAVKKNAEAVAKEVKERKGGGAVDIQKFPYEWYLRMMETKVYSNWDVLKADIATDNVKKAVIMFAIGRDGNIVKIEVEQDSFDEHINRSAMEAVRTSAPFPPLPTGYKDDTLVVHFGFTIEKKN